MSVHVKICGVTAPEDALRCAELGASAIGLNFVPSSPRCITTARARAITDAVNASGKKLLVVGVVANLSVDEMRALVATTGVGCLQLCGDEPASAVDAMLPHAYKAVRIADASDVAHAESFPGDHLLVDAKVKGSLGGTGTTFDWSLVRSLATTRKLTLAGGLTPTNVARAIAELRPYCVDVASGVELSPGEKDWPAVEAFIAAALAAG